MTSLSLSECCSLLCVDSKTLRQWLIQAQMPLHTHRTDARIKCLTSEQVHILANLHDRVLSTPVEGLATASACSRPENAQSRILPDSDLRARLIQMEAQVATLQAQLTDLALQLLQERQQHTERLLTLQAQPIAMDEHALASSALLVSCQPDMPPLACHPTEKRNRLIPLIEYGVRGRYVLISPGEGELPIMPDSPQWFAWLASLSSFRFVGQSGRFSARRGYNRRPNRSWYAQRTIHQQFRSKYIGVSENITIARLEQIAADLQLQSMVR